MTQKEKLLLLLKQAGRFGVSKVDLKNRHHFRSVDTVINDLIADGHVIKATPFKDKYILLVEYKTPKEKLKTPLEWQVYNTPDGQPIARLVPVSARQAEAVKQKGLF